MLNTTKNKQPQPKGLINPGDGAARTRKADEPSPAAPREPQPQRQPSPPSRLRTSDPRSPQAAPPHAPVVSPRPPRALPRAPPEAQRRSPAARVGPARAAHCARSALCTQRIVHAAHCARSALCTQRIVHAAHCARSAASPALLLQEKRCKFKARGKAAAKIQNAEVRQAFRRLFFLDVTTSLEQNFVVQMPPRGCRAPHSCAAKRPASRSRSFIALLQSAPTRS